MLKNLIQKKNLILIVYTAVLLAFWSVTLIFGNREDKLMVLILSPIIPFVAYGLARLMYNVINTNVSFKVMCLLYYLLLASGLFGTIMMLVEFIGGFPNGLSPTLGACGALIIATLDSAKKSIEPESKK